MTRLIILIAAALIILSAIYYAAVQHAQQSEPSDSPYGNYSAKP